MSLGIENDPFLKSNTQKSQEKEEERLEKDQK